MARLALMAIQTVYADALYAGRKAFEYRRTSTSFARGDKVLVYEPGSRGLVTGHFVVGGVDVLAPPFEINAREDDSDISIAVERYLQGAKRATALKIWDATRWAEPKKLVQISPGLRAPQSYVFLRGEHGLLRGDW
jgi:predicted transcriptional regulator